MMIKSECEIQFRKTGLIEDSPRELAARTVPACREAEIVSYQYIYKRVRSPRQRIPVAACVASYIRVLSPPVEGGHRHA